MNDKDLIFMNIAKEISKLSHCVSRQVGCVIVKEGRILSTGVNGTPPGYINCDEYWFDYKQEQREEHGKWSLKHEIHAELNALLYAARRGIGIPIEGSSIYVTTQPCGECTKNLIAAGIKAIYFSEYYDRIDNPHEIQKFIEDNKIHYEKL